MATRAQQFDFLIGPFFDGDGTQIDTPYAKFYVAGTSTAKDAYADKDKSVSFTKKALAVEDNTIFGDGIYKVEIYSGDPDASGVLKRTVDNYKCVATLGNTQTITTTRTGTIDDTLIIADTSGGATFSYTPPDAGDAIGRRIILRKDDPSGQLTILVASPALIDGETNKIITNQSTVEIVSDGTNWYTNQADADTVDGLHTKTISIGPWNMDSTATVSVAHGLTLANIRNVSVMIISDAATNHYPLEYAEPGVNGGLPSGNWYAGGTNIELERYTGGFFDGTDFDSLLATRGYILVQYVN